ncbi:MAG: hypothetical protein ACRDRS_00880 [Pseudonocardiaceae bacterium]
MSVRVFFAIVSIVSLGVLTSACSRSSEPGSALSRTTASLEPAPSAGGVSWLRVSPGQGAPGAAVTLDVACLDNLGAVRSPVLNIGELKGNPDGHQPWHLFGPATVRPTATPGQYQITTTCGQTTLSAAFTVAP